MTDECIEWIHECREVFPKFLGRTTGRIIQHREIDPEALLLSGKRKFEIKINSLLKKIPKKELTDNKIPRIKNREDLDLAINKILSEVKKWNH